MALVGAQNVTAFRSLFSRAAAEVIAAPASANASATKSAVAAQRLAATLPDLLHSAPTKVTRQAATEFHPAFKGSHSVWDINGSYYEFEPRVAAPVHTTPQRSVNAGLMELQAQPPRATFDYLFGGRSGSY